MSEYKFINPYNFIPLGDKCHKTTYQKGDYTGYIECILETKTPLIIDRKSTRLNSSHIH